MSDTVGSWATVAGAVIALGAAWFAWTQAKAANRSAVRSAAAAERSAAADERAAHAGERSATAAEEANLRASHVFQERWDTEWIRDGRMRFTNRTGETAKAIVISAPAEGPSLGTIDEPPRCGELLNGESFDCVVSVDFDATRKQVTISWTRDVGLSAPETRTHTVRLPAWRG